MSYEPKVELISHTPNPIPLLFAVEKIAKLQTKNPFLVHPETIAWVLREPAYFAAQFEGEDYISERNSFQEAGQLLQLTPNITAGWKGAVLEYCNEVRSWGMEVAESQIPIAEMVGLTFKVTGGTIAWREQLVRSRLGCYWVQSGRIFEKGGFAASGDYRTPESVKDAGLEDHWHRAWAYIDDQVQFFRENGVPMQDARELIGTGVLHDLTFHFNLRALAGIFNYRSCWIAQGEVWMPVVIGALREIRNKVAEGTLLAGALGKPPCIKNKRFQSCPYNGMATERYEGKDPLPTCPIWYGSVACKAGSGTAIHMTKDELREKGRWDDERIRTYQRELWTGRWAEEVGVGSGDG